MRSLTSLREQIERIDPVDQREADSILATLERLNRPVDPFAEDADPHHLTASAFVVSTRGVVLHRHRLLGIWVQPGGHIEATELPEAAAFRETLEETGLVAHHLEHAEVFHVDRHPGPKGHTHYDLRYVVVAPPVEPSPPQGESPEVYWFDFEAAQSRCEPALGPAIAKLARFYDSWNVRN
jgi:8-oxo-dGTP pyrophosphatase MutT (NUDIX family)